MYLQTVFELSMVLDGEKFSRLLTKIKTRSDYLTFGDDDEYIDNSLASKGLTFTYRDSQYKKKVKLIVKPEYVLDSNKPDPDKLIRKLEKRVDEYFGSKYSLNDFNLNGLVLMTDIDVRNRDKVSDYIRVLQRIGKVKGFSPPSENWIDDDISFCLDGNSNGISFMIYDLEGLLRGRLLEADSERKRLKSLAKESEGVIRAEVRLTEPKAIRGYTDKTDTAAQIANLYEKNEKIFLDTFIRVVPFGDFQKMDKAKEIIRAKVSDVRLMRRCLRLLDLIPQKRSLLLAQKALDYRKVDEVMEAFADAEVSPVTISKRHDVKKLYNLYKYM